MVRVPPPTTLLRGRTGPEDEGRAEDDALLLLAVAAGCEPPEGFPAVEGLPPVDGLEPLDGVPPEEGLAPEDGFAFVDGEFADGVEGLSDAGGGVACANGAPPPPDRL